MAVKKSPTTKESKNISSKSTVINKAASNVNSSAVSRSTKTPAKPEKIEKEIVKKKNITNADKKSSAKIFFRNVSFFFFVFFLETYRQNFKNSSAKI